MEREMRLWPSLRAQSPLRPSATSPTTLPVSTGNFSAAPDLGIPAPSLPSIPTGGSNSGTSRPWMTSRSSQGASAEFIDKPGSFSPMSSLQDPHLPGHGPAGPDTSTPARIPAVGHLLDLVPPTPKPLAHLLSGPRWPMSVCASVCSCPRRRCSNSTRA